jgi:hypothetical protein
MDDIAEEWLVYVFGEEMEIERYKLPGEPIPKFLLTAVTR